MAASKPRTHGSSSDADTEPMLQKVAPLLERLAPRSRVAVVTLLGSLCPVTRGHLQGFVEARRLLLADPSSPVERPRRLESFDEVLGFLSLNGDGYVQRKLARLGDRALTYQERKHLLGLATDAFGWLGVEGWEGVLEMKLKAAWPELEFIGFSMNGADDVLKFEKYAWAGPKQRYICMGRPGFTAELLAKMEMHGVDKEAGWCIMGPELQDVSATEARSLIAAGDLPSLEKLLVPPVAAWCAEHWQVRLERPRSQDEGSLVTEMP